MEAIAVPANSDAKEQDAFRKISLTALWVGTLDITAANVQYYLSTNRGASLKLTGTEEPVSVFTYATLGGPARIFKYIARAVFDPVTSPKLLIAWGVLFHYLIAFLFTLFLFLVYPRVIK